MCQQVERSALQDPRVIRILDEHFVVNDLYVDEDKPASVGDFNMALETRLIATQHQPAYVVVDPVTEAVVRNWNYRREFVSDASTFAQELEKAVRKAGRSLVSEAPE